jgi:adenylyltransferase/sulfurtransferase
VAHYLAAAGIGKITFMDDDRIELHNIHRQLLFGEDDCGKFKAETAALKLKKLYPKISIDFQLTRFFESNPDTIPPGVSMIADCTDNFNARYAIDEKAASLKIPVMFGAVHQAEGQISLFHASSGTRYSDLYPLPPTSTLVGSCEEEGVLGPVAGIIGSMMATTIIQFITTGNTRADGRLIRFDGHLHETFSIQIEPLYRQAKKSDIHAIERDEIEPLRMKEPSLLLIDVREPHEHDEYNLGGICRPAGDILTWFDEPSFERTLVLYCNHGMQSHIAARVLSQKRPDLKIYHLKDGIKSLPTVEKHIRNSHR